MHVKHGNILKAEDYEPYSESDAIPLAADSPGTPSRTDQFVTALVGEAEGDAHSEAADSMLQTLHGWPDTPRPMKAVNTIAATLLELRSTITNIMAEEAASRDHRWTVQEWYDYIDSVPFDRSTMSDAIRIWREKIFPSEMKEPTEKKLKDAQSNEERRDITRKAFRAWQKEKYGHAGLAKCFLKYPLARVNDLLEEWHMYTQTPEYEQQRAKHLSKDLRPQVACSPPTNQRSSSEAEALPAAACSPPAIAPLRGRGSAHWQELQELRQLRKAACKGKADLATMEWFRSGALDEKLERLTKEHGSGRYYDKEGNAIDLHQHAFEDYLATQHY